MPRGLLLPEGGYRNHIDAAKQRLFNLMMNVMATESTKSTEKFLISVISFCVFSVDSVAIQKF
jgi:hypothetical protein